MRLFRRGGAPDVMTVHRRRQRERPPVTFSGVDASDLGSPQFRPYEFRTDSGVEVRLHDMDLLGFDYGVHAATLTLRFAYTDPAWTPAEAVATPVAVFRFTGVTVWRWEDEPDLAGTPPAARGEVLDVDHVPTARVFAVTTAATRLTFSADHLAVHMEPAP